MAEPVATSPLPTFQRLRAAALRWAWPAAAVVVALFFSFPALRLIAGGVTGLQVSHESLAYRYFNSVRILDGEEGCVFLPQGQTLGVLHHAINACLAHVANIPEVDLRRRFLWFTRLTLMLNVVGMSVILLIGFTRPSLFWWDKLALAAVALAPVYLSVSGIFYSVTCDYLQLEFPLTVLALLLFLLQVRTPAPRTLRVRCALLGAFAGLMVCNKITLLMTGALALWPALAVSPWTWRELLGRAVTALGSLLATVILILGLYYLGSPGAVVGFFGKWVAFSGLWRLTISNISRDLTLWQNGYLVPVAALWILALVWLIVSERGRPSARSAFAGWVLLAAVGHGLALHSRPSPGTLFEAGLFLFASLMACASQVVLRGRMGLACAVPSGILLFLSIPAGVKTYAHHTSVEQLRVWDERAFDMHAWLRAQNRPVIVCIPDNRYAAETVEVALLKGLSDTFSWDITGARPMLDRLMCKAEFRPSIGPVSPDTVVVWMEGASVPSVASDDPLLARLQKAPTATCRSWTFQTLTARALVVPDLAGYRLKLASTGAVSSVRFHDRGSVDVAGEEPRAAANGTPDARFRLALLPPRDGTQLHSVDIWSSDSAGRPEGGGRWSTYRPDVRGLGVVAGERLLNPGANGPLQLDVRTPTVYWLCIDDGGMTTSWRYFGVRVTMADGTTLETVLDLHHPAEEICPFQTSSTAEGDAVAFMGMSDQDHAGEGPHVAGNGKPDACFMVVFRPRLPLTLVSMEIVSSDGEGRDAGGGRWGTLQSGIRGLAVERGGRVMNAGSKAALGLEVTSPTCLLLYIEDGGMTSSWPHFTVRATTDDGRRFSGTIAMRREPVVRRIRPGTSDTGHTFAFAGASADLVGEGERVQANGIADVAFTLTLRPTQEAYTLQSIELWSSDEAGNPRGGAFWDTGSAGRRALAVVRDGDLLNPGEKAALSIRVEADTTLRLQIEDGTMTRWWPDFTLRVRLSDGSVMLSTLRVAR